MCEKGRWQNIRQIAMTTSKIKIASFRCTQLDPLRKGQLGHILTVIPDVGEWFCWCRLRREKLAEHLMDELEPCCPGAAVHIVIWLLTSSSFLPDSLDSNPLHEGTHLSGEISLSALAAKNLSSVQQSILISVSRQHRNHSLRNIKPQT